MKTWYENLRSSMATTALASTATRSVAVLGAHEPGTRRMIILPPRGIRSGVGSLAVEAGALPQAALLTSRAFLSSLSDVGASVARKVRSDRLKLKVVDSVAEDGAKLVEMRPSELQALRLVQPGLRIVPEVFYAPALHLQFLAATAAAKTGSGGKRIVVTVVGRDGAKIRNALVVAFTSFKLRQGADGTTDARGRVTLALPAGTKRIERLYVYPEHGYWGRLERNLAAATTTLTLRPIELSTTDCVRHFFGGGADGDGAGVTVGVVDSGVALDHPDLHVAGGACTVSGEPADAFGPVAGAHGSHVAGIIAAHGTPPQGIRGVAPACHIRSYRVFPKLGKASNFAIIRAIDQAIHDGCDLINLSLGGGPRDMALESAIGDAHLAGAVCIVAAGNDDRSPVAIPAAYDLSLAVSAMGRKGLFPAESVESADVAAPYGTDKRNFVAGFSNVGPEIDVTGPGVGVVSTVPDGYGVMSGTSMACPAVTGAAARMLGNPAHKDILAAARDENRANAILKMVLVSCKRLGFNPPPDFEGAGLPRP